MEKTQIAQQPAYQALRAAGISAATARRYTAHEAEIVGKRLPIEGRTARAIFGGVKVTVVLNTDPLGWERMGREAYGSLNDDWEPGCLNTPPGSPHRFYHPPQSYWDMRREMGKVQIPKDEGDRIARRLLQAQMRRALGFRTQWEYVIATFHLEYKGQRFVATVGPVEYDRHPERRRPLEEMLYREASRRAAKVRKAVSRD